MADLVAFLNARLDEDEQIAMDASPSPWHEDGMAIRAGPSPYAASVTDTLVVKHTWPQEAAHIVRHDPQRVLREVAAKRAILSMFVEQEALAGENAEDESRAWLLEAVLCHLAAIYADHPDYRPEWSVT